MSQLCRTDKAPWKLLGQEAGTAIRLQDGQMWPFGMGDS